MTNKNWLIPVLLVIVLTFAGFAAACGRDDDDNEAGFTNGNSATATLQPTLVPESSPTPYPTLTPYPKQTPYPTEPAPTAMPAQTATATTPEPTKAPAYNTVCRGIWANKANESQAGGRQRIEVGGGGVQHVDFYPDRGIPSVSYIFAPQNPVEWWGYGSIMEWNGPECANYDYVYDATHYASSEADAPIDGRQDSGHSGIVVDTRDGKVYNMGPWTDQQVNEFLAAVEAVRTNQFADLSGFVSYIRTNEEGEAQGCPTAEEVRDPGTLEIHGPAIAHPWWNNGVPSFGQEQVRTKILAGETLTLIDAMGMVYIYQDTPACNASLDAEFDNATFPVKSIQDLKDEGLAR